MYPGRRHRPGRAHEARRAAWRCSARLRRDRRRRAAQHPGEAERCGRRPVAELGASRTLDHHFEGVGSTSAGLEGTPHGCGRAASWCQPYGARVTGSTPASRRATMRRRGLATMRDPGRGPGYALSPCHQGAAQRDAPGSRSPRDPVGGRGGGCLRRRRDHPRPGRGQGGAGRPSSPRIPRSSVSSRSEASWPSSTRSAGPATSVG